MADTLDRLETPRSDRYGIEGGVRLREIDDGSSRRSAICRSHRMR